MSIKKGKAIPVTGCGGPEGCERSRLPHLLDIVSLTRWPPFTPKEDSWYSFVMLEGLSKLKIQ
jgi:hypothetical protein